ncbi:uncharacterized protein MONOS_17145 [Monocercomonoides exilis]|uniref:uncharacterized protein n=1 Tax=Monocercomonoides exilis TaxID=2049356 RepID=UPI00355A956A|nr:hypothetical protein MONOS_17145 [Monocercomonoides exilis]
MKVDCNSNANPSSPSVVVVSDGGGSLSLEDVVITTSVSSGEYVMSSSVFVVPLSQLSMVATMLGKMFQQHSPLRAIKSIKFVKSVKSVNHKWKGIKHSECEGTEADTAKKKLAIGVAAEMLMPHSASLVPLRAEGRSAEYIPKRNSYTHPQ